MLRCLLALMLLPTFALAEEDLNVLPKDGPNPRKMLHDYLIKECQKHFDKRREAVAAIKNADDLKKRNDFLREKFIEALGGFPEKTPLKPQITGTIKCDGYRIEKIIFESRPDHHVTANLYLPEGKGPFPVVLMPIGHSGNGKASFQGTATLLAKNGIAAFPYDPISQGERKQLLDEKGKPFIPSMTNEHSLIGVGALLVGRCTASYRIWDGIRAIDYLCSREDIDAKKIGCTGCSGGGTLTSYLMALDDRILAAAPSCYLTSLEKLFATLGPQDAEQNIPGQVAFGMDHADYILMRAPRPTLILASTKDFFNIEGTWATFREAKQVFTKIGFPERVDMIEAEATHGYPKQHKEAMLRFMSRWLLGKDQVIVEQPVTLVKESDLLCTRTGQVLEEFKGKSCFDLNVDAARSMKPDWHGNLDSVLSQKSIEHGIIQRPEYRITKFTIASDIVVPGLLFEPKKPNGKSLIYVNGQGKATDAAVGGPIEKLVLAGNSVFAVDLRGFGETAVAPSPTKQSYFGTDFTIAFLSIHLGSSLYQERAWDLRHVVSAVAQIKPTDELQMTGIGSAVPIVLEVAASDERIRHTDVRDGLISWSNVVATPVSFNQLTNVAKGALKQHDLRDMAEHIAPRGLTIRNAVDATGKPVPVDQVKKEYAGVIEAYKKLNAEKKLVIE